MIASRVRALIVRCRDWYLVKVRWRRYEIGSGFHAGRAVGMWAKHRIRIGRNCYIGRGSQIECDAEIGHNVLIANSVGLVGRYDHETRQVGVPVRLAPSIRDAGYAGPGLTSKVVIEDDVWIGYGAVVLSGVRIGEGSVVAAGAVVVKDVAPYGVVAGNPAKVISTRFKNPEDVARHRQALAAFRNSAGSVYAPADNLAGT